MAEGLFYSLLVTGELLVNGDLPVVVAQIERRAGWERPFLLVAPCPDEPRFVFRVYATETAAAMGDLAARIAMGETPRGGRDSVVDE